VLIEELFSRGIMKMGSASDGSGRLVGTFNPEFVRGLANERAAEMKTFRWLVGTWAYENSVPATSSSPAYVDAGSNRFTLCEKESWICAGPEGSEKRHLTFDPFSRQWIYVLLDGAYGILRSPGWTGDRIVFTGMMTMIGVTCEWRMSWTRKVDDHFGFVNEEKVSGDSWAYIDEWTFSRQSR